MNRNHRFIDEDELRTIAWLVSFTLVLILTPVMSNYMGCMGCGGVEFEHELTPQQEAQLEREMAGLVELTTYATVGFVVFATVGRIGWVHRREIWRRLTS